MHSIYTTDCGIVLETEFLRYSIGYDGKVHTFLDKSNGENYIDNKDSPYFCYLNVNGTETAFFPEFAELVDHTIVFAFRSGVTLSILADAKEDYLTFEIVEAYALTGYNVVFANNKVAYEILEDSDHFGMSMAAMSLKAVASDWPSFKNLSNKATAYSDFGLLGAKIAVVGAPVSLHVEILKKIALDIPKGAAPVAVGAGGPWARENLDERGDYTIISFAKPEELAENLDFYVGLNVNQLDFHKGVPFRQGDYYFFTDETGKASAFKEKMVSQLTPHGIKAGLHIYSFYIDPEASGILQDPKWQQQLLPAEKYTLAEELAADANSLRTKETTKNASRITGYRALASEYLLIDTEIIKFETAAIGDFTFGSLTRGIAGTIPAEHKPGAKIVRIGSYYSGLCPIIGSELFYEVARRTAQAYNEGGFGMIYFDALDGLSMHCPDTRTFVYYAGAFVNEVLKYTETAPIVEGSCFPINCYFARGRAGAMDHPRRAYKKWNIHHTEVNKKHLQDYLCAILGWYSLYPLPYPSTPPGTQIKYHFFDDVDHMASLAVAYDFGMVYQVNKEHMQYPALRRNTERYAFYNKLRKENYFPERIRKQIRDGKYEYALQENADGSYAFFEKAYSPKSLLNVDDNDLNKTLHTNPFALQKPFIRLEAFPTSEGKDPITALVLDETLPLSEQVRRVDYPVLNPLNAQDHHAVHVRVLGNGSETDAILIRIQGVVMGDINASDYLIPLNFTGWKDLYIVATDNADYDQYDFKDVVHNHYLDMRGITEFDRLQSIQVYLAGDCKNVKMSSVELCEWVIKPIENPTIQVGDQSLTFQCTLNGAEYMEYTENQGAVIYDAYGNSRMVDAVTGSITIPQGPFEARVTRAASDGLVTKARLTFGFTGNEVR